MARRINRATVTGIAHMRINKLMILSKEMATSGDMEYAIRYVELARRISMRTKTKIPREHRYCKKCYVPMVPSTCRVRLGPHRIVIYCRVCGSMKRIPYLKEQRE